jgi:hypothetical protein
MRSDFACTLPGVPRGHCDFIICSRRVARYRHVNSGSSGPFEKIIVIWSQIACPIAHLRLPPPAHTASPGAEDLEIWDGHTTCLSY